MTGKFNSLFYLCVQPPQANITEAFQHFACLYIKYLQIYKKLEDCYDGMVHPQKRIDVKTVLQYVIKRIIELKVREAWNCGWKEEARDGGKKEWMDGSVDR